MTKIKVVLAVVVMIGICCMASDPNGIAEPISVADPKDVGSVDTTMPLAKEVAEPNMVLTDPVFVATIDPTIPRQIVMPKNTKMPAQYKCPVHGTVTGVLLNIEIDGVTHKYCKKCAMQLVCDIFDLNLPKLEVINENP